MAYTDEQIINAGVLKEVLGNFTPGDGGSADSAWPPKFVVFDDDAEFATGYYEIFGEEAANVDQEFVKATAEEASRGEFWLGINSSLFDPAFGIDSSSEAALTASMPVGTLLFMLGDSNLDYTEKYRQVLWMVTGPAETRGTKVGVPVQALMVSGQALPKRAVINNSRMMYDKALEARFSEEQGFSLGEIVTFSKGIISNMGVTLSRYDVVPGTPVMVYESTEATVPSWMGVVTETTGANAYKFMLISKSAAAADLSSYTAKISAAGYSIDLLTNDQTEQPLNLRGRNGVKIVADMPSRTLWFEKDADQQAEEKATCLPIPTIYMVKLIGGKTTIGFLINLIDGCYVESDLTFSASQGNFSVISGKVIATSAIMKASLEGETGPVKVSASLQYEGDLTKDGFEYQFLLGNYELHGKWAGDGGGESGENESFPFLAHATGCVRDSVSGGLNIAIEIVLPPWYDKTKGMTIRAISPDGEFIRKQNFLSTTEIEDRFSRLPEGVSYYHGIVSMTFNNALHTPMSYAYFEISNGTDTVYSSLPLSARTLPKPEVAKPITWGDPDTEYPSGKMMLSIDDETMSITDTGALKANYISNSFPRLRLENGHLYADYPAGAAIYDGPSNPTVVAAPSSGGHVTGF